MTSKSLYGKVAGLAGYDSAGNVLPADFRETGGTTSGTTSTFSGVGTIGGVTVNYVRTLVGVGTPSWTDSGWVKQ